MEYESLDDYVSRMRRAIEKLQAEKLLQGDDIRALRVEARSYQHELARVTNSYQDELGQMKISYQDELSRMKTSYEDELGRLRVSCQDDMTRMRKEAEKLEEENVQCRDDIRALRAEARSYLDELAQAGEEHGKVEVERMRQREKIGALEIKASSHEDELVQMREEIRRHQEDFLALQVELLQETPARNIGKEVRLRYLEKHRRRMGTHIGDLGRERIKCGDRAAHRGRPVVDALLCMTGHVKDREVYPDLYGVKPEAIRQWKDVPEIIEITGFRASLHSEGRLTEEFRTPFEKFLDIARTYLSPTDLIAAFRENKVLQQLHGQLQHCYDKIVAANPRCKSFS